MTGGKTRALSPAEAAAWARLAGTVTPISEVKARRRKSPASDFDFEPPASTRPTGTPSPIPIAKGGLDGTWDRKIARGLAEPDFTLDLHGCTLDTAHTRLMRGLAQAQAMGARVVLLVTGRKRPVDPADRSHRRGAIRAKVADWIAASEHAGAIAAVRKAHPRHGGEGALYLVLRKAK